jgi:hypothetical protein
MNTDIKQRSGFILILLQVIVLSSILVSVPVRALETSNAEVADTYLRGMQHYRKTTPDDYARAILLFNRAIELDPDFAAAHSESAPCNRPRP